MLDPTELYIFVIQPALKFLNLPKEPKAAGVLLLGTALVETRLGHIDQVDRDLFNPGPAFGIFQMERATHDDIWQNYLQFQPDIRTKVIASCAVWPERHLQLMGNMSYAAIMCRLKYRRAPAPLPAYNDIEGLAAYWKRWYNTELGKGDPRHFTEFRNILTKVGEI